MKQSQFNKYLAKLKREIKEEEKSNRIDLEPFKESFRICHTGQDSKGNTFTEFGRLNQAAWIGENSGRLICELELLRRRVDNPI